MGHANGKANGRAIDVRNRESALARLSDRRRRFVEHYTLAPGAPKERFNATRAAKAAGYSAGMQRGHELLQDPAVQAAIEEVLGQLRAVYGALAQQTVEQLHAAVMTDIYDIIEVGEDGIRLRDEISPAAWAAVESIADTKDGLRVKMAPKAPLLRLLLEATGHIGPSRGPMVNVQVNNAAPKEGITREQLSQVRVAMGMPPIVDTEEPE